MTFFKKHQLAALTITYWILLCYMLAALLWWFIALNKQNSIMANYKINELKKDATSYIINVQKIEDERKRKTTQFIGEGLTFLLLILVGAVFVYRIIRKQIKLSQQQQNFMMAITHELKTPIAVAQLNLETLQKRKLETATQEKLITNTLTEANRLNQLCNNILIAARIDEGNFIHDFQELNISNLVEDCIKNFRSRFPQRIIQSSIQTDLFLQGENLLLQMLINNLIENALKYSTNQTNIFIQLQEKQKQIIFSVTDEGIGVAENEKKKIFEKFYRSGNEQTRKSKGTGLGLYLCKRIAKSHHSTISVADNYPQGSIFTVIFSI
jgi:K+-sensing histidine kinase KdpD